MSHVKIHKHHFYTLIFSCLLFVWVTLHQTLADNDYTTVSWFTTTTTYEDTYSEEVDIVTEEEMELNSANKYSDKILEKKEIFKEKFTKLLWKRLSKLPEEKLEKIIDRIDSRIDSIQKNDKISEEKREKIISQLLALLELFEDQLEYNEEFSLEIDLEEILSI